MATLKNTVIDDTGFLQVASGSTAQRPASPTTGMIRYNSTTGNLETYSTGWGGLEPPPIISSITGVINTDTDSTITINGSNFVSGAVVSITGAGVSNTPRALTTTFVSSTQLTAATAAATVNYVGGEAFNVLLTNPSGNSVTNSAAGTIDRDPLWTTSAGNLGTIYDGSRSGRTFTVVATDPDGGSITYAVTSGSLPSNMTLNTSTGVISGTPNAVGSDTTSTFSITPTSSSYSGPSRSFNIIVKAPIVTSFTATGTTSFSVPTGVTTAQVVVVAGGGSGGTRNSGINSAGTDGGSGAGAGGMIDHPAFPLTPGGSVTVTVGAGAPINSSPTQSPGTKGSNSVFSTLTAIGGGFGGCGPLSPNPGGPGGSGGGEGSGGGTSGGTGARGVGVQPSEPGASGTFGYGFPGGDCGPAGMNFTGAGGGGASARGTDGSSSRNGYGGNGRATSISGSSVTYAGGGGGGSHASTAVGDNGGSGGGGHGKNPGENGSAGGTNTGGGGGGGPGGPGGGGPGGGGGAGGPGIVIIRY